MALRENDPLRDLEAQLLREDPDLARALSLPPPSHRREHHNPLIWLSVALAGAACIAGGVLLPQGWLVIAGLLLMGIAAYLLCPAPH